MELPREVIPLVDKLVDGVQKALAENLIGVYLRGSLALGDFNPETSDVDILVVTERPVSEPEFGALAALHAGIPPRDNPYNREYEVSYVDRGSVKRFAPGERRHPTIGTDWSFARVEHRENFILELWMVREHGVVLVGPDPKTLIDAICPDELRAAVVGEFRARMEDWAGGDAPPDWMGTRFYQAFEIETICRGLYTLETGKLPTKPQAVAWAREALPEPWRSLVVWSQQHRADKKTDPVKIPEIMRFARWAANSPKMGLGCGPVGLAVIAALRTETITVRKLDGARTQLETAIRLYFGGGDPVSIHTLSAAAYMVIRDVNEYRGGPMMLKDLWLILPDEKDRDEFLKHINRPENFFKHAENDPEGEISFDPRWTEGLIADASRAYIRLTGERPRLLVLFALWFGLLNARRFPEHFLAEVSDPDLRAQIEAAASFLTDRREFFRMVASNADKLAAMWPDDMEDLGPRPAGAPGRRDRKRRPSG